MIKAVLFDFDETLQDRTSAFRIYIDNFFNEFFPELPADVAEKRKAQMEETDNGGYVHRANWFGELVDLWQWENAPDKEALAEHYNTHFGFDDVIFDGSLPLLKKLKSSGYLVGVITNGNSQLQHEKLKQSGLLPYCDILVISGDMPWHKPDKRIFEHTANELGVDVSECVYVGDHPVNDIEGALGAGMHAIRMNFGWFKNKDLTPEVPTIDNIYDVLKHI